MRMLHSIPEVLFGAVHHVLETNYGQIGNRYA
jgi:hypothetical protein